MNSAEVELPSEGAQAAQGAEKSAKKDSDVGEANYRVPSDDIVEPIYPHGIRLAVIVASLATSIFLVALVR